MNTALVVGAFTAVMGLGSLVTLTFVRKGGYSERDSYVVHAYFADATGLAWKSRAQIAGIQIGEVDGIRLEGPRARLDVRIRKEVELHADACFNRTFPSALLADAVLDVVPGSPARPKLIDLPEEQREITCVRSAATVQEVMDVMNAVARDIQAITGDLAKTVSGNQGSMREIVENLARVTAQVDRVFMRNSENLAGILDNTRAFTDDLAELSSRDKDKFHDIASNVQDLTARLREVTISLQELVGPPRGGAVPGAGPAPAGSPRGTASTPEQTAQAQGIREAIERLSSSATKLDGLLGKVSEGRSVAGRLLVDERLGRKMGDAVESAADYVDRLNKLQVQLQLRSEFLLNQSVEEGRPGAKIYFGMRLLPRPDKFYLIELVSDPRGVTTVTTETISTRPPGSSSENTTIITRSKNEERLTLSAQLGKRYGPFTFRAGVIEGSGGLGSDLHLLHDSLQVSFSFYQFSRPYQNVFPRAKTWLNWYFLQNFYVTAGADDFLNRWRSGSYPGGRSFNIGNDVFFGGGFFFTDEDIKTLIGSGVGSNIQTR
jgi:phospholipid/cholesterol/gamma-HCH transport system substrate-binding protein